MKRLLVFLYHVKMGLLEVKRNPRSIPWRLIKWSAWHLTGGVVIVLSAIALIAQLPLYLAVKGYWKVTDIPASIMKRDGTEERQIYGAAGTIHERP